MLYIANTLEFHMDTPTVVTFGKFDGLHRGHELLMDQLKKISQEEGLASVVFTFDIPPRNSVEGKESQVLTTNQEKHMIFEQCGIDYLVECPFTREAMCMEPEAFIRKVAANLKIRAIVVGTDFHFGYKAAGDYRLLQKLEKELGYRTIVLEKMQDEKRDISSTYVREKIAAGKIEKANSLLGYEYYVGGEVVHGNHLGTGIGFPTANLVPASNKLLPPFGVYAVRVCIGEKEYAGVANVGKKPTVGGDNPVGVETFLLNFHDNLYGTKITVHFLTFLRPERKFASLEELMGQLKKDTEATKKYFKNSIYKNMVL